MKPVGRFCTASCPVPCPLPPGHCALQGFVSECIPGALRNRAVLHPGYALSICLGRNLEDLCNQPLNAKNECPAPNNLGAVSWRSWFWFRWILGARLWWETRPCPRAFSQTTVHQLNLFENYHLQSWLFKDCIYLKHTHTHERELEIAGAVRSGGWAWILPSLNTWQIGCCPWMVHSHWSWTSSSRENPISHTWWQPFCHYTLALQFICRLLSHYL